MKVSWLSSAGEGRREGALDNVGGSNLLEQLIVACSLYSWVGELSSTKESESEGRLTGDILEAV